MSEATLNAGHVERFLHELLYEGRAVESDVHRLALCVEYLYEQWKQSRTPATEHQALPQHHLILQLLHKLEDHLTAQDDVLARLKTDNARLLTLVTGIQTSQNNLAQAMADANKRLFDDIERLRNQIGSGNVAELVAIADSMEANLNTMQTIKDSLQASADAEAAVDPAPLPLPLTITTLSTTIAAGAQAQFSASLPVSWSCNPSQGGSIDTNGLYTAPATGGVSDTITATATDGQTASMSVSIV